MAGQVQGNKRGIRELRILVGINIKWPAELNVGEKWRLSGGDGRGRRGLRVKEEKKRDWEVSMR